MERGPQKVCSGFLGIEKVEMKQGGKRVHIISVIISFC